MMADISYRRGYDHGFSDGAQETGRLRKENSDLAKKVLKLEKQVEELRDTIANLNMESRW